MLPNYCRTVLHASLLAVLVLKLNADSEDSDCSLGIEVRRNTAFEILLGQDLVINCKIIFCNDSQHAVTWFKLDEKNVPVTVSDSSRIKTEWKELNKSEGVLYLKFQKVLSNDSGLYHCHYGHEVGHSINVSVHDGATGTQQNPWMYVYSAAGIVAFVIIVIVMSVISMRGCKGKSKKEAQTEIQYVSIPIVEPPFQHGGLEPLSRESPSVPPSVISTKTLPSKPNEVTLPRDNGGLYGKINEDRKRKKNAVEEGSSVVYAALNHQLPPAGAAARSRRPQEFSEYAAIRLT
ncbi:uncharacterized protein LOC118309916 isoform X2 [Scophthalmus maximus]|uniref:Ig-like domain-containing protein n=1 Tax=Scophthalmus maximus TaxID=52904 RepID=A0A8D3DBW3_SCOMX|nr:uncharacterized protein LOC118309916 isoform X2 [Scophthalmus maximus]